MHIHFHQKNQHQWTPSLSSWSHSLIFSAPGESSLYPISQVKSRSISLKTPTHAMQRTQIKSLTPKSLQSPACFPFTHRLCTFRENINIQSDTQNSLRPGGPEAKIRKLGSNKSSAHNPPNTKLTPYIFLRLTEAFLSVTAQTQLSTATRPSRHVTTQKKQTNIELSSLSWKHTCRM